ncbi:MAG: PQQ-binding-like beta-propeller repeat protein [Planctomycetia bacterium]|nr:PQQ-binding-like beta-propeller repeat protein [Planctomycetia bacterium]
MNAPSKQIALYTALALLVLASARGGDWPQFRGPGGSGVAVNSSSLPAEIGPDQRVVYKVEVPPGHSSPVISGEKIFLTAVRDQKLLTMALDRGSGKTLWEVEAPYEKLEAIHGIGSHAQPSPATDGERVVSLFGSAGLFCHSVDGKPLWHVKMGHFNNDFGCGTSPIIVGDYVVLCQDHDTDSFLTAIDKRTGKTAWRTDRSEFPRNYCTPVLWDVGGKKQIVVAATLRIVGYDFATGEEMWTVRGLSRAVCMTPVVGGDGNLYAAGWSAGGDAGERISLDPWDTAKAADKNQDGALARDELPNGPVKQRYSQIDRDKIGGITRGEYDYYRGLFDKSRNVVMAIKPGASGESTNTHLLWEQEKHVPFCASPLYYEGRVFTVKDGGIVSCLDARTGKPTKQARVSAGGDYFASPVAGDGKVYLVSEDGKLTVLSAEESWQELGSEDFGEPVYATPALVDNRIYLRTAGHLYCFE